MKSKRPLSLLICMLLGMTSFGFCEEADIDTTNSSTVQFRDDWFGEDKVHHAVLSFMLTWWGTMTHDLMHAHGKNQHIRAGAGFAFTLGFAKEVRDSREPNNRFSWKDIIVDLFGIGLAVFLINKVQYAD